MTLLFFYTLREHLTTGETVRVFEGLLSQIGLRPRKDCLEIRGLALDGFVESHFSRRARGSKILLVLRGNARMAYGMVNSFLASFAAPAACSGAGLRETTGFSEIIIRDHHS